jgi:hypothetical protein
VSPLFLYGLTFVVNRTTSRITLEVHRSRGDDA